MKLRLLLATILGSITFFALPVSAAGDPPIIEELMRKYTFPLIFLQLLMAVLTVGYLYVSGTLPRVLLATWKWFDERFALHRYASLAKREYYSVVFTLLPSSGRTMPQSHTERYNVKSVWY